MKMSLDHKKGFLCVLTESEISDGPLVPTRQWHPVHPAEEAEVWTLVGRPVTEANPDQGIYVDEEGNVFQLAAKGRSKPMEVEHTMSASESRRAPRATYFLTAERRMTITAAK